MAPVSPSAAFFTGQFVRTTAEPTNPAAGPFLLADLLEWNSHAFPSYGFLSISARSTTHTESRDSRSIFPSTLESIPCAIRSSLLTWSNFVV